jgi:hypothetical protein
MRDYDRSVPQRAAHKAENEARFRHLNEQTAEELERSSTVWSSPATFVCECGSADCAQTIELTLDQYRDVRESPVRFVVVPGHENLEVERIVVSNDAHFVVEKIGEAAAAARELEPS